VLETHYNRLHYKDVAEDKEVVPCYLVLDQIEVHNVNLQELQSLGCTKIQEPKVKAQELKNQN
jgi:hypothetical protein